MKAIITFANNESLTIEEDDIIFIMGKNAANSATVAGEFIVKAHVKPNLINSILTAVFRNEYFYTSANPSKTYNPKMIVSIESE